MERVDHVNVVVDDLAAMTAFYRDVLGMTVTKQATISGDWIAAVTGYDRVEADVVYLAADPDAGSATGVELIRYRAPDGERPDGLGAPNTKGIRHIAFRMHDLDAAVSALRAAGADVLSAAQDVSAQQVDYAAQRKRIVYARDPEGNLLEFCDFQTA